MKMKKIPDIIKAMSESTEEITILKYENILTRMFFSSALLTCLILNIVVTYLTNKQVVKSSVINSLILLIIYLVFEFFCIIIINEKLKENVITAFFCAVLVLVVIRFYYTIGATVWTIAINLAVISMLRIKKSMLIIISAATFVMGMYVWYKALPFQIGTIYYVAQTVTFSILFFIMANVHDILIYRYGTIHEQYQHILSSENEINMRIAMEEKITKLAYYDHLTGLPNRRLFNDSLSQCIINVALNKKNLGVLFLDLDAFKRVNDTMGHAKGDELLKLVSNRLKKVLRKVDIVSRVSGDEFLILIEDLEYAEYLREVSERILDMFKEPFTLDNHNLYITTSIGGALYPVDGEDVETLIKNADIAMYIAKDRGKNKFQLCTSIIKEKLFEEMRLTNSLYGALERNELELYYQPQVSLISGEINGLEALIRWNNTELGIVSPVDFIYIAEKTGLILPIGEWVIKSACIQNKAWQEAGILNVPVAVNLSVNQFENTKIVEGIEKILEETNLKPTDLELEITESIIMKETGYIVQSLKQLKKLGVTLAIDDFGTEYSSLNYIKQLPVDRIKIDISFVRGININEKDEAIIKVIIALARNLGLKVIAEGVETKEQLDFLRNQGCDDVQGYYFYKPMPAYLIGELMKKKHDL